MKAIYTLGIYLYTLIVEFLSFFYKKARMTRLGQWRTNQVLREHIDRSSKYIWFHAASLGEFEQGRPMIEEIRRTHPEYKILLTFFSPSGYEVRKNYEEADIICYLPFDSPYKVRKFLNLARPAIAIFIKYEFWYNYLSELHARKIPIYLVSAIFRREQLFFKWYGLWYRKMLFFFTHIFVQDEASRKLLARLNVKNVTVAGDTRFDRVLEVKNHVRQLPMLETFVKGRNKLILVAGSTWPQDEALLLPYFNAHPEILLIIAPHEIHRSHLIDIESNLTRPSIRFSELHEEGTSDMDCLIIDSFGLLSTIYRYGNLAYIGGGFGAGIHNTLEAAVYGLPVIFGPKYQKFREARDLINIGGAVSVSDKASFLSHMDELVNNQEKRHEVVAVVNKYMEENSGVTQKILKEIPL